MKKLIALLLALTMLFALTACGAKEENTLEDTNAPETTEASTPESTEASVDTTDDTTAAPEETTAPIEVTEPEVTEPVEFPENAMTHAEFMAAESDAPIVIEAYVQNTQSFWNNQITVYAQDEEGGYVIYNMACSEEDAANLIPGTKIRVTGYKAIWKELHEVAEGATFEFVEDAEPFFAEATDLTDLLGEDLTAYQGMYVSFKGMTVAPSENPAGEEVAFLYGWDGSGEEGSDSDLYFNVSKDGESYTFVIEYYLCDENSAPYQAVQNLNVGDVIDLEGYLYWYNGMQPHIIAVNAAE